MQGTPGEDLSHSNHSSTCKELKRLDDVWMCLCVCVRILCVPTHSVWLLLGIQLGLFLGEGLVSCSCCSLASAAWEQSHVFRTVIRTEPGVWHLTKTMRSCWRILKGSVCKTSLQLVKLPQSRPFLRINSKLRGNQDQHVLHMHAPCVLSSSENKLSLQWEARASLYASLAL